MYRTTRTCAAGAAPPADSGGRPSALDSLAPAVAGMLDRIRAVTPELFGDHARRILPTAEAVLILACGGSYHLALVAKGWIESLAAVPVNIELASEFRYRESVANPGSVVVALSRSRDLDDVLGAIELAVRMGMPNTLGICDSSNQTLASACRLGFTMNAIPDGAMTSARTGTMQLIALFLLALVLARSRRALTAQQEQSHLQALHELPEVVAEAVTLTSGIQAWAERLASSDDMLFLGRGMHYPVAQEGALNMKEIARVHAEAFSAGELKHGPLALVSADIPVVVTAPGDRLAEKLNSNLQEVSSRNGKLFVFADTDCNVPANLGIEVMRVGRHRGLLPPIVHTIPMQLLARYTALERRCRIEGTRDTACAIEAG